MPDYVLPELARSLRALGARHDASADAAHAAIFVPLLEARGRAGAGSLDRMLAALRGESIAARIEKLAIAAGTSGVADPAQIRALTARTVELLEPIHGELALLDERAKELRDQESAWEGWVGQLRAVFASADVACGALARLIAERPVARPSGSWFAKGGK